jgi:hypothetical protein
VSGAPGSALRLWTRVPLTHASRTEPLSARGGTAVVWDKNMTADLPYAVPYDMVLAAARASSAPVVEYLRRELEDLWYDAYVRMTKRATNVLVFTHGTFDYIYDDYATLEGTGAVERDDVSEARLVAAVGFSRPNAVKRDDARLRGWVGPTSSMFGRGWDKGHFIAHSIGGAVDRMEANVFIQLRSVNRGGYRRMERYCAANPGVFCFSRPLYDDPSARPAQVEFGVLKPDGEWWIQLFENRDDTVPPPSPASFGAADD